MAQCFDINKTQIPLKNNCKTYIDFRNQRSKPLYKDMDMISIKENKAIYIPMSQLLSTIVILQEEVEEEIKNVKTNC